MKYARYGILILVGLMCLGGWLVFGAGIQAVVGYTLVIGSFAGLVFLARREAARPLSQREAEVLSHAKAEDKRKYIRTAITKGLVLGLVSASLALSNTFKETGFSIHNLILFFASVLIITFACCYMAVRMWEANESKIRDRNINPSDQ